MRLEPLTLSSCSELADELRLSKEEFIKTYGLFGGYPKYYVAIEDFFLKGKTAEEILDGLLLTKDSPLEEEVNTLLAQEFGARTGVYYSIMEAIANGHNSISTIATYVGLAPTSLTRQIKELKDYFELIEMDMPYSGKRGVYRIKHPFMHFWFSQIYRNYSEFASRSPVFLGALRKNLNAFWGRAFEKTAFVWLVDKLNLTAANRQWGKVPFAFPGENVYEIDLIGKCKETLFAFEFKWKSLKQEEAMRIIRELEKKSQYVSGLQGAVKLGLVAKKVAGKEALRQAGFFVYDLDDF